MCFYPCFLCCIKFRMQAAALGPPPPVTSSARRSHRCTRSRRPERRSRRHRPCGSGALDGAAWPPVTGAGSPAWRPSSIPTAAPAAGHRVQLPRRGVAPGRARPGYHRPPAHGHRPGGARVRPSAPGPAAGAGPQAVGGARDARRDHAVLRLEHRDSHA